MWQEKGLEQVLQRIDIGFDQSLVNNFRRKTLATGYHPIEWIRIRVSNASFVQVKECFEQFEFLPILNLCTREPSIGIDSGHITQRNVICRIKVLHCESSFIKILRINFGSCANICGAFLQFYFLCKVYGKTVFFRLFDVWTYFENFHNDRLIKIILLGQLSTTKRSTIDWIFRCIDHE